MLRRLRRRSNSLGQRWIVIDVETTGVDLASDALLSIGGVVLSDGRIIPADSFEVKIKRATASTSDNIIVHGIGKQAQLQGADPSEALHAFLDFVGAAPLAAFHAHFDQIFLKRAIDAHIERSFGNAWLDLAELARALEPEARLRSLDHWLQRYQIPVYARHSAAGDAFTTALLATHLLALAKRLGASDFVSLQRLARNARWLQ
ncbi:MAG TPA: 3'-5' exonuclease [Burkholderiaceae bacterium]|nr:3'-5' exonuclease [Burkholderiaceae bacterium]